MTDDSNERHYLLTLQGVVMLAMVMDGNKANQAKVEIAELVTAWWHGGLLPRREAPLLVSVFDRGEAMPEPDEPAPSPITVAGGALGLQKHLIALADQNRGLDHVALKKLFDGHQVVMAVWPSPDSPGKGFLTLKGVEHLLAQTKRNQKKILTTMTAIPCTNKSHAELLQQTFVK